MAHLQDLYTDYVVDDNHHIEPYYADNVHVYDYELDDNDYYYTNTYIPKNYDDYDGIHERVIRRETYNEPKVPFYGETTNQSHFTWKTPVFEKPENTDYTTRERISLPFYSETTNRAVYSPKIVKNVVNTSGTDTEIERPHIPFYSETTNRADYIEKAVVREKPMRKTNSNTLSQQVPFYGKTTNMSEFTSKALERTCPAENYLGTKRWKARYKDGHWWFRGGYRATSERKANQ